MELGARPEEDGVLGGVVEEDEGVEVGLDFDGEFGDGETRIGGVVFDVEGSRGGEEWREECVCVFCEW